MRQCDWCGTDLQTNEPNSDSYVTTIDHKIFCKIHTPGQEPFKDCIDYAEDRGKCTRKNQKKNKSAYSQKKVMFKKKKK